MESKICLFKAWRGCQEKCLVQAEVYDENRRSIDVVDTLVMWNSAPDRAKAQFESNQLDENPHLARLCRIYNYAEYPTFRAAPFNELVRKM